MYHWTVEYCLKMPAIQFFSMLDAGRKKKTEALNRNYLELCSVIALSTSSHESYEAIREHYQGRLSLVPEFVEPTPETKKEPLVGTGALNALTDLFGGAN